MGLMTSSSWSKVSIRLVVLLSPQELFPHLPLLGESRGIVVESTEFSTLQQTAYVATGSYGLAIVDASQFNNPIILNQLDLPGNNVDVAIDTNLLIAVVAGQTGGLHFIDVSDPILPTLTQTIDIQANDVEILDGIVYASVSDSIFAIDLITGEILESQPFSGGPIDVLLWLGETFSRISLGNISTNVFIRFH